MPKVSFFDTGHRLLDIKQVRGAQGFHEGQQTGMCAKWGRHFWFNSGRYVSPLFPQEYQEKGMGVLLTLSRHLIFPPLFFSLTCLQVREKSLSAGSGSGIGFMASDNNNNNNTRAKKLLLLFFKSSYSAASRGASRELVGAGGLTLTSVNRYHDACKTASQYGQ